MPVVVNCACGKQLRVPDEYVGKRVKCPSCGEPQTVKAAVANGTAKKAPVPTRPVKAAATKPIAAAAKPGTIQFQCTKCNKPMQAKAEYAGKAVRCPGCQTAVKIPKPEEEDVAEAEEVEEAEEVVERPRARIQSEKPRPKPSKRLARDDDDDDDEVAEAEEVEEAEDAEEAYEEDDEEYEDNRPRKKKKARGGMGVGLWIGIGVGALLLIGGGVFAAMFFFGGGSGSGDLALIPADAQGFGSIRVGDIWKLPQVLEAVKAVPKAPGNDPIAEAEGVMGIGIGDIDRATFVVKDFKSETFWAIISTSKPYDRKKLSEKMELDATERKHEGKTYLMSKLGKGSAVHFASDKQLVLASNESGMKEALELATGKKKGGGGPLANAISTAGGKTHLVIGFKTPPELAALTKSPQIPPAMKAYLPIAEFAGGMVTMHVSGETIQVEVTANYPNAAKATDSKKALDGLKATIPALMAFVPMDAKTSADAKKTLDTLTIDQSGTDVKLKVSSDFKSDELVQGLKAGGGAFGGGAFGGGGGGDIVSQNNLKQMALAFHNYAGTHNNQMPASISPKKFSWRVEILPFIEQQQVYNALHLNEPWDSPHNKRIAQTQMPNVYKIPLQKARPGETFYKLFTGPKSAWNGDKGPMMPASFQKGTSATLMVVEAATPVLWTKPEDIPFNPTADPTSQLRWTNGVCNVGLADGSVVALQRATIKSQTLKDAINQFEGGGAFFPR